LASQAATGVGFYNFSLTAPRVRSGISQGLRGVAIDRLVEVHFMRIRFLLIAAFLLAASERPHAAIYAWSLGDSAQIVGTISSPVAVSVRLLSFTPGAANPSYSYNIRAYYLTSQDAAGTGFSFGDYGVAINGDPNQPRGDGSFWTTVFFDGATLEISDGARFLVSSVEFSHSFGFATGSVTLGLELPDGLSVAGREPIASAVPEPTTWAMLLLGFLAMVFMTYRRPRAAAVAA
jgi:hypothetical protein